MTKLEQTLHGYENGHRLIRASVDLPAEATRLMLPLSDAPEGRMLAAFDGFLSGYPLLGTPYYALARTWAAPEMRRPGCVWTHTLLIDQADLAQVEPRALIHLFSRPDGRLDAYGHALTVGQTLDPTYAGAALSAVEPSLAATLLAAYYTPPPVPVVVVSDDRHTPELTILALMAQQWPLLRRRFSFAVAGSGLRRLAGTPFEVQVLAPQQLSLLRDDLAGSRVVGHAEAVVDAEGWLQLAVADSVTSVSGLRDFLWQYGSESSEPRAVFATLTKIFALLATSQGADVLPRLVATAAATELHEMKGLKLALFGDGPRLVSTPDGVLLRSLLPHGRAFDPQALRAGQRTARLIRDDPSDAVDLVADALEPPRNRFKEAIVNTAATTADDDFLVLSATAEPSVVRQLIELNPELASSPALWKKSQIAKEVFAAVNARGRPSEKARRGLLKAILSSAADLLPDQIVQAWGPSTVSLALDVLNAADATPGPASRWARFVAESTPEVARWLRRSGSHASPDLLRFLARTLDPREDAMLEVPAATWLPLAADDHDIQSDAFVFTTGLLHSDTASSELLLETFARLHEAASGSGLPESANAVLDSVLPQPGRRADISERLRRALVESLADKPDLVERLHAVAGPELLPALGRSAVAVGGPALAKRLDLPVPDRKSKAKQRRSNGPAHLRRRPRSS